MPRMSLGARCSIPGKSSQFQHGWDYCPLSGAGAVPCVLGTIINLWAELLHWELVLV